MVQAIEITPQPEFDAGRKSQIDATRKDMEDALKGSKPEEERIKLVDSALARLEALGVSKKDALLQCSQFDSRLPLAIAASKDRVLMEGDTNRIIGHLLRQLTHDDSEWAVNAENTPKGRNTAHFLAEVTDKRRAVDLLTLNSYHVNLHHKDEDGNTPFHVALRAGNPVMVEAFAKLHRDKGDHNMVERLLPEGVSPLQFSIQKLAQAIPPKDSTTPVTEALDQWFDVVDKLAIAMQYSDKTTKRDCPHIQAIRDAREDFRRGMLHTDVGQPIAQEVHRELTDIAATMEREAQGRIRFVDKAQHGLDSVKQRLFSVRKPQGASHAESVEQRATESDTGLNQGR